MLGLPFCLIGGEQVAIPWVELLVVPQPERDSSGKASFGNKVGRVSPMCRRRDLEMHSV